MSVNRYVIFIFKFFYIQFLENASPFCGVTDALFWTSGFQSQSGQPYLHLAEAQGCSLFTEKSNVVTTVRVLLVFIKLLRSTGQK